MTTKKKPEHVFIRALEEAYPLMLSEVRRGIVGLAVRAFVTPGDLSAANDPRSKLAEAARTKHAFISGYNACEGASQWGTAETAWTDYEPLP